MSTIQSVRYTRPAQPPGYFSSETQAQVKVSSRNNGFETLNRFSVLGDTSRKRHASSLHDLEYANKRADSGECDERIIETADKILNDDMIAYPSKGLNVVNFLDAQDVPTYTESILFHVFWKVIVIIILCITVTVCLQFSSNK